MSDVVYHLNGIEKTYAGRALPAVSIDLPLTIQRGEILVIIGPSGAGKSTLLRLLALVESPTRGKIEFLGSFVNGTSHPPLELRRRVVLVFQRPLLMNEPVKANVAYGLKIRGLRDVDMRVDQALRMVGLHELKDAAARSLSGGEMQRVALARALAIDPDVLLLDEPTANLDPYNVSLIEQIIRDLHHERQTSIVLVTHNVFQARRLGERVGLLLNGKLIELGTGEEFFERPRDPRTRAFVKGEMVY
ncbi:MAG TPA: phosphate ABC transporter ATP-binding protein [Anaerolineae bacterium]